MTSSSQSNIVTKAVILVGGPSRGTRFRPLSLTVPKPLFPVAGKALLYHQVAALVDQVPSLREVLLIGFYEPDLFSRFIEEAQSELRVTVRYLREYQALGTAGGLYHFRDQILRGDPHAFFVLHSDVCCSWPLASLLEAHLSKCEDATKPLGTLLVTRVQRELASRFGCVVADPKTGEVLHYVEKPESFVSDLISCGILVFSRGVFDRIQQAMRRSLDDLSISDEVVERARLELNVLRPMAGNEQLYVYETQDFWRQVKTAGSALPANALYLSLYARTCPQRLTMPKELNNVEIVGPVTIHPSAVIGPGSKIGPNVSIGANVTVGDGVRIRDAIILDNVDIKSDACILDAIVGWESRIGSWARVEGSPDDSHTVAAGGNNKSATKRPNVTILGSNVQVERETVVRHCIVLPHKELKASYYNEILM